MNATVERPAPNSPRRPWKLTSLVIVAGLILVFVSLVGGPALRPPGTVGAAIGRRVPYFQLEPLTGDAHAVSLDDLQGRVTLVNYWGTWCPPCVREFPEIVALAERFAGKPDFRIYAVSCGPDGSDPDLLEIERETRQFLKSKGTNLPTYGDQNAASRRALVVALSPEVDSFAYPTTIVFDRHGVIRGFWQGYHSRSAGEMAGLIEELLGEPTDGSRKLGTQHRP